MNSLYTIYIKRTAIILFAGILFTLLFLYLAFVNSNDIQFDNIFYITSIFSEYTSSVFLVNSVLLLVLLYGFFSVGTKASGAFIRYLPIKSSYDFMTKVLCTLLFICLISAFEYLTFKFAAKELISDAYREVTFWYDNNNIYLEPLSELYNEFDSSSLWYFLFTLLLSSAVFLFSGCIGVTGFSVAMPVIIFFSFSSSLIGIKNLINDIYNSSLRETAIFIAEIAENLSKSVNNITEHISPYFIILSVTIVFYISAFLCNKYFDFSKSGQLFIFPWAKYLTYFFGCILGGLSFYFIGSSIIQPQSLLMIIIICLVSLLLSFIVIYKIEKLFT